MLCSCGCAPLGALWPMGFLEAPGGPRGSRCKLLTALNRWGALRSVGFVGRLTAMADVSHRGALCCVELKEALAAMAAVHHRGALCHVEFSGAHPAAAAVGHQGALLLRCVGFMALWGWGFWGWGLLGSVCLTGFLASLPTPHPTPRTPPPHPTAPHFAPRAVLVSIGGHGLGKRTARLLHAPQTPPPIPHRGTPPQNNLDTPPHLHPPIRTPPILEVPLWGWFRGPRLVSLWGILGSPIASSEGWNLGSPTAPSGGRFGGPRLLPWLVLGSPFDLTVEGFGVPP